MVLVRKVGVDLLGINQEPFPAFNLVGVGFPFGIRGYEGACAGYAVVEQIVVPGVGTIRVQRFTLFPAVLIKPKSTKRSLGNIENSTLLIA